MIRSRAFPESVTRHGYWLAVLVPLLMPLAWSVRGLPGMSIAFAWIPLMVLYGLLPLADVVIGRDVRNPRDGDQTRYPDHFIPLAVSACYLAVLAWSLALVAQFPALFTGWTLAGWVLSLGNVSSVAGINTAHELIHRRIAWQRALGGFLLAVTWYPGFKLEHPRWHHVHVATPADPSSAPQGSTIYGRVPAALVLNTIRAFRLAARSSGAGRGIGTILNETAGWYGISVLLAVLFALALGGIAALVFLLQGLVAAALLEVINYVEHYGLRRARREDGRFEPPGLRHSWDCDYWLSNAVLLQLPRHSDHHTHPSRPFSRLCRNEEAPMLPLGYPSMVVIAFLPALWRKIMHARMPMAAQGNGKIIG